MTKNAQALTAIRESNDGEIAARIKRTEDELFQHKLKRYTNQLENTNLIRAAKREIARCKTVLSQRKAGIEKGKE